MTDEIAPVATRDFVPDFGRGLLVGNLHYCAGELFGCFAFGFALCWLLRWVRANNSSAREFRKRKAFDHLFMAKVFQVIYMSLSVR